MTSYSLLDTNQPPWISTLIDAYGYGGQWTNAPVLRTIEDVYREGFLNVLLRMDDPTALSYVQKRWPGAVKLGRNEQGAFGCAFVLPRKRVLKFTAYESETHLARDLRRRKPKGVVPVLTVGRWYYVMPKLVMSPRGAIPHSPGICHTDYDEFASKMCDGKNIMMCPRTKEVLWIDLEGISIIDEQLVDKHAKRSRSRRSVRSRKAAR